MNAAILTVLVVLIVRSLLARGLARWNIGAPVAMVVAGAVVAAVAGERLPFADTVFIQHSAEVVLAVLLFVDATQVKGRRLWGRWPRLVGRALFVAMPIALALAVAAGAALFPTQSWAVLLVLACIVVPIDFAPADNVVRDTGFPARVRSILNVESGYNDGLISPLFLFALALTGYRHAEAVTPWKALESALPSSAKAIAIGVLLGIVIAIALEWSTAAKLTTAQSRRFVVLMIPLTVYYLTVQVGGNGFVAAFACGIAFRYVYRGVIARRLRRAPRTSPRMHVSDSLSSGLLEEVTALLTMVMWFVVGIAVTLVLSYGIDWPAVLYCVLALTVIRLVSVLIGFVGSGLPIREQMLITALGPRGTTSIVFGLIAFNVLPAGTSTELALTVTVLCVLGSVLIHGIGIGPLRRAVAPHRTDASSPAPSS